MILKSKFMICLTLFFTLIATQAHAEPIEGATVADFEHLIDIKNDEIQLSNLDVATIDGSTLQSTKDFEITFGEKSRNSLQLLINILDSDAPSTYRFKFENVIGMSESTNDETKSYRLYSEDFETVAWLQAPWAFDANGSQIETSFVFRDGFLIQHVNFSEANPVFPITADPYLWVDLIDTVTVITYSKTKDLKIAVTPWLGLQYVPTAVSGPIPGVLIAQNFGWPEVLDKVQARYGYVMRNYFDSRETYKNQWDCHALGAPLIFGATITGLDTSPTWDLEGRRAPNSNVSTWINTHCNW
jgi:hypothetical protein